MNKYERENEPLWCYCLIANVCTVMAKILLWFASAQLHTHTHMHHPEPCVCMLSRDEARCHRWRDTFVVAPLQILPHAQCTTIIITFSHYLTLSIALITFWAFIVNGIVVICAIDEGNSAHICRCAYSYVGLYTCNNSSIVWSV